MVPVPLFRLGPSRDEVIEGWPWLDQVVLDGALISDLELELEEGVNRQELPMAMGLCPEAPVLVGGPRGTNVKVLVPDRGRIGGPPQLEG